MAEKAEARAYPRKRFFLEMFTRDISLEDCLLDLIDNSIDSLVRRSKKDPIGGLLRIKQPKKPRAQLPDVTLDISPTEIVITDTCGGIPTKDALEEVFNFGHSIDPTGRLGAYGIGLKRALFKIGEKVHIDSQTNKDAFTVTLDVKEWAARDSGALDDWTIPVTLELPVKRPGETTIRFTKLRDEVRMRLSDTSFVSLLARNISRTYAFFLDRIVAVKLNGKHVEPEEIEVGESDEIKPARKHFKSDSVEVDLIASLAPPQRWVMEKAGWYILCNGRVVLTADKSDVTGWSVGLPTFHSKHRGFVGLAFFESTSPLALPWTTTKRGLNKESPVYQEALREMVLVAKPIIRFLDGMYPSEAPERVPEREMVKAISETSVQNIRARPQREFVVNSKRTQDSDTIKVQYDARKSDIDRIRKCIKDPRASAGHIGLMALEHFLKTECP